MKRLLIMLGTAMLLTAAVPLVADDFSPSPVRGYPLSYVAFWEFDLDPGMEMDLPPDIIDFTGDGIHDLFNAWTHGHRDPNIVFWDPAGHFYTLETPGVLAMFLNNWVDDYPYKHIWVQITYTAQDQPPYVSGVEGADESMQWADPYIGYFMYRLDHDPNHAVEYWQLQPNPNMEFVYIYMPPFVTIDEVVIDTWSTVSEIGNEKKVWSQVKALYR